MLNFLIYKFLTNKFASLITSKVSNITLLSSDLVYSFNMYQLILKEGTIAELANQILLQLGSYSCSLNFLIYKCFHR